MLVFFILLYLLVTLLLGLLAGRLVKNSTDFILAGRRLPFMLATTTVFATWFGSETVMGASGEFAQGGLQSVMEDPFGASLCLLLVGFFFARPLYRMNLTTFGDFYRVCFGKKAEFIAAIFLIWSYLGWVAAQMVAMGVVLTTILPELNMTLAITISSLIVITYTVFGGMWAVSITDFFQMILIITGLIVVTVMVTDQAGGFSKIIGAAPEGFFRLIPSSGHGDWVTWLAALLTLGLGSVPQQDVYQRVMASRTENIAAWSSIFAGLMYLSIALLPLYLGLAAKLLIPMPDDPQIWLTTLINERTGLVVRIFFFGALLSAIMSTASGALLAPSVILSENLVKPFMKHPSDRKFLWVTRISVVVVAMIALILAYGEKGIYELVGIASEISLVSLFIPLCAGLFFKSRNEVAAVASMVGGITAWGMATILNAAFPPIFTGTLTSLALFLVFLLMKGKGSISVKKGESGPSRRNTVPELKVP
ncbi:MAG: sodium:solute symporter family protein [Bacteroidia bacterium]|nr:sodium:solute symporter family protein [Bacteroidia bacterium]